MATKVQTTMIDDLDGTEADDIGTVRFGLDGTDYEIDLNAANAKTLRDDVLGTYIEHARCVSAYRSPASSSAHRSRASRRGGSGGINTTNARNWLLRNVDPQTKLRGRIPGHLLSQVPDDVLSGLTLIDPPDDMTTAAPETTTAPDGAAPETAAETGPAETAPAKTAGRRAARASTTAADAAPADGAAPETAAKTTRRRTAKKD